MSKKRISIKPASELRKMDQVIDNWVNDISNTPEKKQISNQNTHDEADLSRFTIIIPSFLHRRIKKICYSI